MYTLEQKIKQLFIVGYKSTDINDDAVCLNLIRNGIGGIIFFTKNIISKNQIIETIHKIKTASLISPFLSIDQEGGRVERTENIHNGKKYLSALDAAKQGLDFVKHQTETLCEELSQYGFNMNFAPVLDTNTNPQNPIIGIRAYGNNPNDVIKFSTEVFKIHQQKGIIPVGKHFPGHGDTSTDSHLEMPIVDLSKDEFKNNHLKPFQKAIDNGIEALMASHVYYQCYDKEPIPASLSKNILTELLRNKLGYTGVIVSDDMVMGAVADKDIKTVYIQALKAGINVFIYRNSDEKLLQILKSIAENAKKDEELLSKIEKSFKKVIELKRKYKIL